MPAPAAPAPADAAAGVAAPAISAGEVSGGDWKSTTNIVSQTSSDTPALLLFGDNAWKDYTLELEAQKTGGDEGFLIAVRAKDGDHLVWFNVGGWGNTRSASESVSGDDKTDFGDDQTSSDFVEVQTDKWHKIKVTVAGNKIEGFLDGKSASKANDDRAPAGRVVVGNWSTQANFRNVKITSPEGKVLWEGTPSVGK